MNESHGEVPGALKGAVGKLLQSKEDKMLIQSSRQDGYSTQVQVLRCSALLVASDCVRIPPRSKGSDPDMNCIKHM
jgi:hypothetical protein